MAAEAEPAPPRARPGGRWLVPAAIVAMAAGLGLLALTEPSGGLLTGLCLVAAAALAAVAVIARSGTAGVVACALAATVVVGSAGIALGHRAGSASVPGAPFPAVVGLPLAQARAAFQAHGPVRFQIVRAPYGRLGTVLRATGYSTDGSYTPGSTITLVVGTVAPHSAGPQ